MDPIILMVVIALATLLGMIFFFNYSTKKIIESAHANKSADLILQNTVEQIKSEKNIQLQEYKEQTEKNYIEKERILKNEYENLLEKEREKIEAKSEQKLQEETDSLKKQILSLEKQIAQIQLDYQKEINGIEKEKSRLLEEEERLKNEREGLEKEMNLVQEKVKNELENVSKMSAEEAKKALMEKSKEEIGMDLLDFQKKAVLAAKEKANLDARQIVLMAIQRCSSEVANEATITLIKLKNDGDKGKIIGKAGRNIMWLEKTLGVEIIIDETPDIVTISGFNSIRRHIAKKTLELLLEDGRLHPSAIEEMYQKARSEISDEIVEAGHEAVESLGIVDFPEKLIRIIGRLKFRTSYGQNMLKHSIEMARLASTLCDEVNAKFPHREPIDRMVCIKGALLHDIGKAIDEETQPKGDHVELGAKVADIFGLDWRIKKCITSHHDESYEDEENGVALEAIIVDACDNISGGRPGARKESLEAYYQRLESMEKIAEQTPGVNKAWIMKGARELWVFFDTEKVTPSEMQQITKEIANRIQMSVRFPGEIKILGMWEERVVEYAV